MSDLWTHEIINKSFVNQDVSTLVFAGDFVMRRGGKWEGVLDEKMAGVFSEAEYVGVNMEAPIKGVGSPIEKVGPALAMDIEAADCLKDMGVDWVSFANNHAMDFGADAMLATKETLEENGIAVVGVGTDENDACQIQIVELKNGLKVALLSVCEYEFGVATRDTAGTAWCGSKRILEMISMAKIEGCFVVVCSHGGVEEVPLPPVERREQLRGFVNAGADLVIGHHPHVPQGWEEYAGKMIFYSVGDFVFDTSGKQRQRVRDWGYCVRVNLNREGDAGVEIIGFERVNDQVVGLGADRNVEVCLAYLLESSQIIAGDDLSASWGPMSEGLMQERYGPFLESIFTKVAQPKSIRTALSCLISAVKHSIKVRWGSGKAFESGIGEMNQYHKLLLLNLFRCESHHWSISRSLSTEKIKEQDRVACQRIMEAMDRL